MAVFNPSTICKTYPRGIRTAVTSEFHRAGRTGMEAGRLLEFGIGNAESGMKKNRR
jgi:hypothetical protein